MQETQEMWVWSLGQEDPLQKKMATHSSILAWKIPWTEKPGGLQSTGSQRVRHGWAARGSSQPRNWTRVFKSPALASMFFTTSATWEAPGVSLSIVSDSLQPVDCNQPCCSLHGILQARIPEWVVIPFFRRSSQPRNQTLVSCIHCRKILYCLSQQGSPT